MIADAIRASLSAALSNASGISVAISGSMARGTPRLESKEQSHSDVDVLVFIENARVADQLQLPESISCKAPVEEYVKLDGSFIFTTKSRIFDGPPPDSFIDAASGAFVRDDLDLQASLVEAVSRPPTEETYRYRLQPVAYYWAKWRATGLRVYLNRAVYRLEELQSEGLLGVAETVLPLIDGHGDLKAARDPEEVVNAMARYLARRGVRPLQSTAAVLDYDDRDGSPADLFRLVQRRSFVENHGLEPHDAVTEFECELIPVKEMFTSDEN